MTSDELNRRIAELCDEPEDCGGFEAFGGKSIPYVGWFWRTVNFGIGRGPITQFGILPGGEVGFMERNKWGYSSVTATDEQWENIKELLEDAVLDPARDRFEKVYDAIQGLRQ